MKQYHKIFEKGEHQWFQLYKDPTRSSHLVGTNEYVIKFGSKVIVTDPGGTEAFPEIISALAEITDIDSIDTVFCSHQDPDIFSSITLWLQMLPDLKVYLSRIWIGFMLHFGGTRDTFELLPDEGASIDLNGLGLQAIPAHFLHSAGNFQLYDPTAKVLFSGDTGAAIIPLEKFNIYVEDFDDHIQYIEAFHTRWFGSNDHKNQWCERAATMDIDMICPQHGSIYKGDDVKRFLDWLYNLRVGVIKY